MTTREDIDKLHKVAVERQYEGEPEWRMYDLTEVEVYNTCAVNLLEEWPAFSKRLAAGEALAEAAQNSFEKTLHLHEGSYGNDEKDEVFLDSRDMLSPLYQALKAYQEALKEQG